MEVLFGLGVIAVVLALIFIGTYNRLIVLRQNVQESWSAIETELRRRYDLIPNIVETVKGYASHERDTLEAVIKARNSAANVAGPDAQMQAQSALGGALNKLMALSEAYPQLKANENFVQLQNQLNETETRISQARRFYNANVKELNTACQAFPSSIIAGMAGVFPKPYYGIEDAAAYDPVSINFSGNKMDADPVRVKLQQKQVEEDKTN